VTQTGYTEIPKEPFYFRFDSIE